MDEKDRRILDLLQRDARTSIKAIAADVSLARSSVRARIERLERDGVILGYRTEVAPLARRAQLEAFLLLRLSKTPSPRTIRRIIDTPQVVRCTSVGGETDVIVEVRVDDAASLNRLRDDVAQYPFVTDLTTMLVLKREKY